MNPHTLLSLIKRKDGDDDDDAPYEKNLDYLYSSAVNDAEREYVNGLDMKRWKFIFRSGERARYGKYGKQQNEG